jgi:hypothetical protein
MQLQLPLFPSDTKLFNACFGVFMKADIAYYLHNGQPVGMHDKGDLSSFRCKIAQFISVGLRTRTEVSKTLHVTYAYVKRCCRLYKIQGEAGFWEKDNRHGHAYKVTPDMLRNIQQRMNKGESVLSISKKVGITESNIRYYITKGELTKNLLMK